MKKTVIAAIIVFGWNGLANASLPVADTPALKAYVGGNRDASHERDLGLRHLSVSVAVRGAVAETTIEAIFLNPITRRSRATFASGCRSVRS